MALFNTMQKNTATSVYNNLKKYLVEKDGFKHVLMINSFSKMANQNFECENKYTTQINEILSKLQEAGYEIVDIKLATIQNQGITGQAEGFNTLIIYK